MNVATAAAAAPEKRARKRLIPGQRVSGSVGDWIPNPNPNLKRKRKAKLYGYVVSESGNGKYNVRFDDGVTREVASNILKCESASASLPPSERPLPLRTTASASAAIASEVALGVEVDPDDRESEDERGDPQNERSNEDEECNQHEEFIEGANGTATGGVFVGEDLPRCYHERLAEAREKIRLLLGTTVQKESFTWTVVAEHHCDDAADRNLIGITGIELQNIPREEVMAQLFLHMMFRDWQASLNKMNAMISLHNEEARQGQQLVPLFEKHEFITGLALMIGASCYSDQGEIYFYILFDLFFSILFTLIFFFLFHQV